MKKEFDLKIDGGTLDSIKIDSSNSLMIATYKRDVGEFKAGDIIVDDLGALSSGAISIFKCINLEYGDDYRLFDAYVVVDADCDSAIEFDQTEWDYIDDQRLATDQEKQLLFLVLKKQGLRWNAKKLKVEKLDTSEIVVDLETACEYLGKEKPNFGTLSMSMNQSDYDKFKAQITLQLMCKAWNKSDKFEADWENRNQLKYSPMFEVEDGKIEFSGTSFFRVLLDSHTSNFSF